MTAYSQAYQQISAIIDHLEQNQRLYKPESFIERTQALDLLELHLLDDSEQGCETGGLSLMQRGTILKQKLTDANERLFAQLFASIRANDRAAVMQYFKKAARQLSTSAEDDDPGYDELDLLVTGLLEVGFVPAEPQALAADMVFYQPTPARIILKLIDELHLKEDDLFYDFGSGLGHVPIVVNLLTGIRAKGVELEGAYFRYSIECVNKLALPDIEFVNADARDLDYEDGTIFYLYTPFQGEILRQVLRKLQAQSKWRAIKVCTYGPCTLQVAEQNWLQPVYQTGQREDSLAIFASS